MDAIDKINSILDRIGMTGAELERKINVSNSVYSQWNTKTTKPSKKSLLKVAEVLGVDISEILPDKSEQKENPTAGSGEVPSKLGNTKYFKLNDENRALIDSMIEKLLKSQSDD